MSGQEQNAMTEMIRGMALRARVASRQLAGLLGSAKNAALHAIADTLVTNAAMLMAENAKDIEQGEKDGLAGPLLARLKLPQKKIEAMAQGLCDVAQQVDPVGQTIAAYDRPNGLRVEKRRVPLGVVGIIFESRPNVTADAAGLCLKSGNAVILRGGKEAIHSNKAIARIIREGLKSAGINPDAVQLIETTDRAAVGALVRAQGLVDLVIPRGGEGLIKAVVEQATVPVIKHYRGVCHVYVDRGADLEMALQVAVSAKVDGVAYCNTEECLLIHKDVAKEFLPQVVQAFGQKGVELRVGEIAQALLAKPLPGHVKPAEAGDFGAEFLEAILAVKVVASLEGAIDHINRYGSQHTDAIITRDIEAARRFVTEVDSASVMVNASTRFADGAEYGLGAEIGISTDKLHARGPMGAADLCTYKFVVTGNGQVRK